MAKIRQFRNRKGQLSLQQKIFIIKNFYKHGENLLELQKEYIKNFDSDIDGIESLFQNIVSVFEQTGSVAKPVYFSSTISTQPEEIVVDSVPEENVKKEIPQIKNEEEVIPDQVEEENQGNDGAESSDEDVIFEVHIEESSNESWQDKKPKRKRKTSSGKVPVKKEIKLEDITDDLLQCFVCDVKFPSIEERRIHVRSHKDFICNLCNGVYKNYQILKDHKQVIHASAEDRCKFRCTDCNSTFTTKPGLKKHIKRSHGARVNIICEVCGKSVHKEYMIIHMRNHTGEKPYKCTQCPRSFKINSSLALHMRVHTGERPFKCNYCDKCFIDSSTRNVHHRQHTGENPYVCHLCGKSCKQKQNLRSHIRHVHTRENVDNANKLAINI